MTQLLIAYCAEYASNGNELTRHRVRRLQVFSRKRYRSKEILRINKTADMVGAQKRI